MKNPKITLTKDGLILIDAPDKSKYIPDYDNGEKYNKALSQAIKEGVKFKDEQYVKYILHDVHDTLVLEQGKLYDIPEGYQVKVIEDMQSEYGGDYYAVLEPLTKQEPTDEENKQIDELIAAIPENERKEAEFESMKQSTPVIEQKEEDIFQGIETMMFSAFMQGQEGKQFYDWYKRNDIKGAFKRTLDEYAESKQLTPNDGWQLCPKCNGTGMAMNYNNQTPTTMDTCDVCNGSKIISIVTGKPPQDGRP